MFIEDATVLVASSLNESGCVPLMFYSATYFAGFRLPANSARVWWMAFLPHSC